MRDLLSHRARIAPNLGILGMLQMAGSDDSRDQQADRARLASWMLARAPQSEGFTYSNVGYAIAGSMIENAAGVAFETLMVDQIAEPLGLSDFGFGPPQDNTEAPDAPNQPRGHTGGKSSGKDWQADNPPVYNSAGRAHLTLSDMARYLSVVLRGTQGEAAFLTAGSWKQLVAVPDAASPYALGWGVDEGGTLRYAGSNTLWYARFVVDPFSGRAYVFVTNSGDLDTTGAVEKAVMGILGDYSFEASPQWAAASLRQAEGVSPDASHCAAPSA